MESFLIAIAVLLHTLTQSGRCELEEAFYNAEDTLYPHLDFKDINKNRTENYPTYTKKFTHLSASDIHTKENNLLEALFSPSSRSERGTYTLIFPSVNRNVEKSGNAPNNHFLRNGALLERTISKEMNHGKLSSHENGQSLNHFTSGIKTDDEPFNPFSAKPHSARSFSTNLLELASQRQPSQEPSTAHHMEKRTLGSSIRDSMTSSSCRLVPQVQLAVLPGCIPKSVLTTKCQGTCHSRSVPDWNLQGQDEEHSNIRHCTCCAPNVMRYKDIVFICPGRSRARITRRLAYPFRCSCRPCDFVPELESTPTR